MRFSSDAASENGSRVTLRGSYGLFIGGSFVSGSSVFKTISPATEEVLAEVTHGTTEDVDRAVAAARHAYERVWSMMPGRERARYLLRIARLMRERAADLAVLESFDSGKPIRQTRDVDLPLATAHFFYHAGWADKLAYAGFGGAAAVPVRPLGVVGQVIGWSSPLLMLAWKIAPALACGNTVVLKPAETTPLTALLFCDVLRQAELPPGVVNIVTGDGSAGAALVQFSSGSVGLQKGVAFPGEDVMDDVHATAQAVWDIRRLLSWIRSQEPESRIGLNGMSLGGYIAALVASLEPGLTCAILGVLGQNLVHGRLIENVVERQGENVIHGSHDAAYSLFL